MITDILILGSGPAGLTAAIYAARAGRSVVVIEGSVPGGQLTITTDIENFPGFPDGIGGQKLMGDMRKQAVKFGAEIISEQVTSIDFSKKPFGISVDKNEYNAKVIIVATGASALWLGLESEKKLMGKGVSACATCDGFFFKNQHVVVIGGGDSALEEAIFLTKFAEKVTVIHRRSELRASKILQDRAKANSKIEFEWNKVVVDILDIKADKVTAVKLKDVNSGKISELKCEGVFVAVGYKPNTDLFRSKLKLDEKKYIVTEAFSTKTNIPGVFAAGDVCDPRYRQAITAAGSGCMAAIDAEKYLNELTS